MNQHVRVVAAAGIAWMSVLMTAPAGAAPEPAAPAKPAVALPLTDAEIAGLRFQVDEDGKKLELLAKFEVQKLDERDAKRFAPRPTQAKTLSSSPASPGQDGLCAHSAARALPRLARPDRANPTPTSRHWSQTRRTKHDPQILQCRAARPRAPAVGAFRARQF